MWCKSTTAPATVNGRMLVYATGGYSGKVSIPVDVKSGDLLIHFAITFGGKVRSSCLHKYSGVKIVFGMRIRFCTLFCDNYDKFCRQWIASLPFLVCRLMQRKEIAKAAHESRG